MATVTLSHDLRLRILRAVEARPDATQRELAEMLGISLGKANYCLKALIAKGLVKARNFKNNRNKLAYMYYLTPRGIEEKLRVTYEFLKIRIAEVELLQSEIEDLRRKAGHSR
jgi:EPS-associated MarR family transcriptional regulator